MSIYHGDNTVLDLELGFQVHIYMVGHGYGRIKMRRRGRAGGMYYSSPSFSVAVEEDEGCGVVGGRAGASILMGSF